MTEEQRTLQELEMDALDAENASAEVEKRLIDTQLEAERAHRKAMDARRAVTKFKYEQGV